MFTSPWKGSKTRRDGPTIRPRPTIEEVHKHSEALVNKASKELAKLRRTPSHPSNGKAFESTVQPVNATTATSSVAASPTPQHVKEPSVLSPATPSPASSPRFRILNEHSRIPMVAPDGGTLKTDPAMRDAESQLTQAPESPQDKDAVKKGNVNRLKALFESRQLSKSSRANSTGSSKLEDAEVVKAKKERRSIFRRTKTAIPMQAIESATSPPTGNRGASSNTLTFQSSRAADAALPETPKMFGVFPPRQVDAPAPRPWRSDHKAPRSGPDCEIPETPKIHSDPTPATTTTVVQESLPPRLPSAEPTLAAEPADAIAPRPASAPAAGSAIAQEPDTAAGSGSAFAQAPDTAAGSSCAQAPDTAAGSSCAQAPHSTASLLPPTLPPTKLPAPQKPAAEPSSSHKQVVALSSIPQPQPRAQPQGQATGRPKLLQRKKPTAPNNTPVADNKSPGQVASRRSSGASSNQSISPGSGTPHSSNLATTRRLGPPKSPSSKMSTSSCSSRSGSVKDYTPRINTVRKSSSQCFRPAWNSSAKVDKPAPAVSAVHGVSLPPRRVRRRRRSIDSRSASGVSTPSTVIRKSGASSFGSFDSLLSLQDNESVASTSLSTSSYQKQAHRLNQVRKETPLIQQMRQQLEQSLPHLRDAGLDQPPPPTVPNLPPVHPDRHLAKQASKPIIVLHPRKHRSKKRVSWDESSISNTPSRSRSWDESHFEEASQIVVPPNVDSACSEFYDIVFDLHSQMSNQVGSNVPPEVQAAKITKAVSKKLEKTINLALRDAHAKFLQERVVDGPSANTSTAPGGSDLELPESSAPVSTEHTPDKSVHSTTDAGSAASVRTVKVEPEVTSKQPSGEVPPVPKQPDSPQTPPSVPTIHDILPVKPMVSPEMPLNGSSVTGMPGQMKVGAKVVTTNINAVATSQAQGGHQKPGYNAGFHYNSQQPRQISVQAFTGPAVTPAPAPPPEPIPETKKKFSRLKKFWSEVFALN